MKSLHLRLRHVAVLSAAAAMAFAVTGLAAATTTGIITNGKFILTGATDPISGSFQTVCATTSASGSIAGWTVTSGSVDVIGTYWANETSSSNSLDMNGTPSNCLSGSGRSQAAGTISQTFSTILDATYVVQFWFAGNPTLSNSPQTKVLFVSATGGMSTTYTFHNTASTTRTAMGWVHEAYTFVATSSTTVLTFAATTSNTSNTGPAIDNVTVTQTLATGAQCKDGGWQSMVNPATSAPFKNQGACVSYFATSGDVPIGS